MSVSDLVGEIDGLRARTRRASFGGAVPLAILGALVMLAAPVYAHVWWPMRPTDEGRFGFVTFRSSRPVWLLRLLHVQPGGSDFEPLSVYWLLAVPVAFAAIAAYYVLRARRTGLSVRGGRVALAGLGTMAVLVAVMQVAPSVRPGFSASDIGAGNFVNPLLVVVAGAFAVAWVERSKGVLAVAIVFLLAVLVADFRVYADTSATSAWTSPLGWGAVTLALGGVLLLGALAVTAARRR